ncbi:MAG TPA: M1 family metallopeptidase [Arachidicoccus sp.]|nr:M1 family metallopeptidase [Arachidicoccus sp.]
MRNLLLALFAIGLFQVQLHAQKKDSSWKQEYRASAPKINDIVHTKLEVRFDYSKSYLYGKAWITLQPHFYATDSLTLDAKGMNINKVMLVSGAREIPLKYQYEDSLQLHIQLNKTFQQGDKYVIFIDYTAKPDERRTHGSAAITDDKGLYFINPKGTVKDKPIQIWTQGETESNSAWFPTIDKPDQKTTIEIAMRVPDKYVTLSNGLLSSQKKNGDRTRTDSWKLDQPIAPYLVFMGVGDYAIIKDSYKGKPVEYYVEHDYAPVARKIFGHTPEMIAFFSKILDFEYVWPKYDQIVGRDYVSGAMENVTATLHQESAQQNARQLTDGNKWEGVIAHELFHHWFGDLVTAESWSNLTVNESFANYSEQLWDTYKYGKDAGDAQGYNEMQGYLGSGSEEKDLVRFFYKDKEDMFDAVSYNKGGRVLNMLRHYVGDKAFFKSLNIYLNAHKFGTGEAHQLRLAFEKVTGQDLNWFWNQWYFGAGHPILDISYVYDSTGHKMIVAIEQQQKTGNVFQLPIDIDIYLNGKKTRHSVWMRHQRQLFSFAVTGKPDLVNVDGDKILLAEKKDHKTLTAFIQQYKLGGNYVDRKEAIDYASDHLKEPGAKDFLVDALKDAYFGIRKDILEQTDPAAYAPGDFVTIAGIAQKDSNRLVRAAAIDVLGITRDSSFLPIFEAGVHDSSYSVAGASLQGLAGIDRAKAMQLLPELGRDAKGRLAGVIQKLTILTKTDADFDKIYGDFTALPDGQEKAVGAFDMLQYLGNLQELDHFKKMTDVLVDLRDKFGASYPPYKERINQGFNALIQIKSAGQQGVKDAAVQKQEVDYLKQQLK